MVALVAFSVEARRPSEQMEWLVGARPRERYRANSPQWRPVRDAFGDDDSRQVRGASGPCRALCRLVGHLWPPEAPHELLDSIVEGAQRT